MSEELRPATTPAHRLNFTTTRIEMFANGVLMAHGTGFVVRYRDQYALVTAWHNLSGKSPIDGSLIAKIRPDEIRFEVTIADEVGFVDFGKSKKFRRPLSLKLYDEDDQKIWVDFNKDGYQVDVALILLNDAIPELMQYGGLVHIDVPSTHQGGVYNPGAIFPPMEEEKLVWLFPRIRSEVFILGYPKHIQLSDGFPVWKRASIASEPNSAVVRDGVAFQDILYIDALTKAGMSGAPVIYMAPEGDFMWNDKGEFEELESRSIKLVGVYGGRDGSTSDENDFSMGRVWKANVVIDLFRKALTDKGGDNEKYWTLDSDDDD